MRHVCWLDGSRPDLPGREFLWQEMTFCWHFYNFELANESCWKYNVFQTFFKRVIEQTRQNKAVLLALLVATWVDWFNFKCTSCRFRHDFFWCFKNGILGYFIDSVRFRGLNLRVLNFTLREKTGGFTDRNYKSGCNYLWICDEF